MQNSLEHFWVPELVIDEEVGSRAESVLKFCFNVRCGRSC